MKQKTGGLPADASRFPVPHSGGLSGLRLDELRHVDPAQRARGLLGLVGRELDRGAVVAAGKGVHLILSGLHQASSREFLRYPREQMKGPPGLCVFTRRRAALPGSDECRDHSMRSPWSERSSPMRSSSDVTRRPMTTSMILRRIQLTALA